MRHIPTLVISCALAACAAPPPAARPPVPPPAARVVPPPPPAPAPTADEAVTQAWLQQEVERQTVHPANRRQPAPAQPTAEPATDAWLQQEVQRQEPRAPYRVPGQRAGATDEGATQQWLQQEVERVDARNPERPPEPIYQVVERPVYVDRTVYVDRPYWRTRYVGYGYDCYGEPVYYQHHQGYYGHSRPRSTFPWNTAVGAGLGAVIGHQSGRRDRGAAIGAGIGLLFDLARWH